MNNLEIIFIRRNFEFVKLVNKLKKIGYRYYYLEDRV